MTTGELRLTVRRQEDRHIFEESYFSGAFKLSKPLNKNGVPLYYLLHVGGGYVSGDEYRQTFHLLSKAALYLTTQSATKVYKGKVPARQETIIKLEEDSHLTLLQDPVILYENAIFHQITHVHLGENSTFHYSEIFTPGWSAEGKHFTYRELYSDFQLMLNGKKLLVDRLRFNGQQRSVIQLADYTHYGTYICINQVPDCVFEQLISFKIEDVCLGFSKIQQYGFTVKVLAYSTGQIEKVIADIDALVRREIGMSPLSIRKF